MDSNGADANGQLTTPKEILKATAKAIGVRKKDLLVLSPQNDPYDSGSKTDLAQAKWFGGIYHEFNFQRGVHLRRIHYLISSVGKKVIRPDEKVYENTLEAWDYLQKASKHARFLGIVDARDFVDHRNPDPMIYAPDPNEPDEPAWYIQDLYGFELPTIDCNLDVRVDVPGISIEGYEYDDGDQVYHLEVWTEKNTMNDVLEPICQEYSANLCPALGFKSITNAVELLTRVQRSLELGRHVRIFYISDFDPAGDSMPVAVSRQLQFWMEAFGLGSGDLKVKPLVMTQAQVEKYDLPRKPIKESDLRKAHFEQRHGEGAVELDALEAIYPGELAKIVETAMAPYRDLELEDRMGMREYEADTIAHKEWSDATEDLRGEIEIIKSEAAEIVTGYEDRLKELSDELDEELKPLRELLEEVEENAREKIEAAADELTIELPERPTAESKPPDESDWLFDSTREMGEQLAHFRRHQEGLA